MRRIVRRPNRFTRLGSIPINVTTILKKTAMDVCLERIKEAVSKREYDQAVRALDTTPAERFRKPLEMAALSSIAGPAITTITKAVKGGVDSKSLRGVTSEIKKMTRGDIAGSAAGWGLSSGILGGGREMYDRQRAKKVIKQYLAERPEMARAAQK